MKQFLLLHYGFEQPTPEIMEAWKEWFASITDVNVAQSGFMGGRQITAAGVTELPWGPDSITGYNIIEAPDLDAAEKIAAKCPFIKGIRVYELRGM